ncbi:hypothetical protein BABINDRAFT_160820 [Babjeviella inositovora NRRL Y-12698]|uniref:Nucleolar complex protein 2 n=1 Tax=Babjeviella inositovora NRRL Y-12698 TaxID=984486 RepID=A0A1E3QS77_9ASCO|nr:uncharacterized protein BABINDRAFT_160820 [Babjeviella inositovora NRRL Y-12698]ODQ80555.1 hypothetical protein BABINDRAFT_160820 [Babjeviella inositovora NRRL Y-12698]
MGKVAKSTKKFQAKHLKHTLEHRKEVKKHNQLFQARQKKKRGKTGEEEPSKPVTPATKEVFDDMSVEQFFEGGFELPKDTSKKSKKAVVEGSDDESSSDEEDHEEQLEKLAEKDPEFYKYLKNNDKELLDFKPVNPLDAMSDAESEEEEEAPKKKKEMADKTDVTIELVRTWAQDLEKPNVKLIKNVVMAFKAAVHINDEEEYKYTVTDSDAFKELMMLVLKKLPRAVQILVPYKKSKAEVRSIPQNNKHVKGLAVVLKSHAGSLLTLLKDITNTETAALVLSSVQEVFPYFLSHRRLLKEILSAVVDVWSTTKDVETQIAAFAFLNNVSREFPKAILENVLKFTYSTFIKRCRQTNVHNMPMINFQKNSAAELFGIDQSLAYQVGFEFVRQLAIHLRNSINQTSNAQEGFKAIYNWQYCHSLDFWSRVLSQHCNPDKEALTKGESPLRQLIYPLVQVTLGAIRLIPTAQFFPLRFYLIRSLIRLSQNTGVFIPLFPLLNEILASSAITKNPKATSLLAFDFEYNIKANAAYLGTKAYQDGLCEQFVDLTAEFFVLYSKNIAFPELATPAIIQLRRYIKKSKNIKFNKQLGQLVEKLNQNVTFVTQQRADVEYGPNNRTEVNHFLGDFEWEKTPLGTYVVVQRQVKEERERILRDSLQQDEEQRQAQADEDEEDIELGESDESEDEE